MLRSINLPTNIPICEGTLLNYGHGELGLSTKPGNSWGRQRGLISGNTENARKHIGNCKPLTEEDLQERRKKIAKHCKSLLECENNESSGLFDRDYLELFHILRFIKQKVCDTPNENNSILGTRLKEALKNAADSGTAQNLTSARDTVNSAMWTDDLIGMITNVELPEAPENILNCLLDHLTSEQGIQELIDIFNNVCKKYQTLKEEIPGWADRRIKIAACKEELSDWLKQESAFLEKIGKIKDGISQLYDERKTIAADLAKWQQMIATYSSRVDRDFPVMTIKPLELAIKKHQELIQTLQQLDNTLLEKRKELAEHIQRHLAARLPVHSDAYIMQRRGLFRLPSNPSDIDAKISISAVPHL